MGYLGNQITTVFPTSISVDSATISGNTTVGGTLGVTGVSTLSDNIVFDASGKGVHLGVTSATASNLLEDYEEGTWTPTFNAQSNPTNSYSSQTGVYTKVGDLVTAHFNLAGSYTGGSGSFTFIGGLPFAIGTASTGGTGALFWGSMALGSGYYAVIPYNSSTGSLYYLGKSGVSVATANVALSEFGGSFNLVGVLIYRT
mgnify:FL=1|jgi:hypothetical protein|tara:strand:- start:188 stop:787 length:600 start_codon:yes stop_codon:yes gene_type:complete